MDRNNLYPISLKCSQLEILLIGGGYVAEEKLHFLTKSSPDARVTLVAPLIREGTEALARACGARLIRARYHAGYLQDKHLVIAATDDAAVNETIYRDCRQRNILVNVADKFRPMRVGKANPLNSTSNSPVDFNPSCKP